MQINIIQTFGFEIIINGIPETVSQFKGIPEPITSEMIYDTVEQFKHNANNARNYLKHLIGMTKKYFVFLLLRIAYYPLSFQNFF